VKGITLATRNPERTKARILQAARREFAAKGIGGARVDAIAKRARVNKRMLYHYFGNKDALFQAVLLQTLNERVAHVAGTSPDTAERWLGRAEFYRSAPEYVRLLMWEALERPAGFAAGQSERAAAYERLRVAVERDQSRGAIPADLDAGQWALAELAIGLLPAAFPQITSLTAGAPVGDAAFDAAQQRFLTQLAHVVGSVSAGEGPPTV